VVKRLADKIKMRNFAHSGKRSRSHQFIKRLFRHCDSIVETSLKSVLPCMKILLHIPFPPAETIAGRTYIVTVDAHIAESIHILKTKVDGLF
jgi:hypothetical protein